jgi:acetyltransferase-like isoleucine patch superfamily enzyme
MLNKIISKIKGEEFVIDPSIPFAYVLFFFLGKMVCLICGMISLKTSKLVFVSPSSTIKCKSKIELVKNRLGLDVKFYALSFDGLKLGSNVSMGFQTHMVLSGSLKKIAKGIVIGNNVGLGSHGHYGSGVGGLEIGDDTIIGNYVSFHPENHNFSDLSIPIRLQGVNGSGIRVGSNCWIGAKVTFLDGAEIGSGCVVAAGALVRGKFPDNVIVGGLPAKIIGLREL